MIELTISFDPASGRVAVSGPADNPPLAVFLLEVAKQRVLSGALQPAAPPSGIVLPHGPVPDLHGRNGGPR